MLARQRTHHALIRQREITLAQQHSLRIIGGLWRGRKLTITDQPGLRPTGDRLRETLFNWLQPYIRDSHCLDLFAGTGSLGFEALSRGAKSATLVEQSHQACKALRTHCQTLGANAQIEHIDAIKWLKQAAPQKADIVFIDPPFAEHLWAHAFTYVLPHLAEDAMIYVETPRNVNVAWPSQWAVYRAKQAGQVTITLLKAH